jgi:preprotein translocase subunit SecF
VFLYVTIRYEWKMAVAALAALGHDLIIAAGIYSLVGFELTPSTVVGLLTILGFSLYDTVVVFDKVNENVHDIRATARMTYGEAANLAVNQTLMRSINTSLISLLPVAGLLFIGVGLLGVGTIKDLALILFVGLAVGAYSSLFLATPIVVDLKEIEPEYRALTKRVMAKRASAARAAAAPATATATVATGSSGAPAPAPRPGSRKARKPRRRG